MILSTKLIQYQNKVSNISTLNTTLSNNNSNNNTNMSNSSSMNNIYKMIQKLKYNMLMTRIQLQVCILYS